MDCAPPALGRCTAERGRFFPLPPLLSYLFQIMARECESATRPSKSLVVDYKAKLAAVDCTVEPGLAGKGVVGRLLGSLMYMLLFS